MEAITVILSLRLRDIWATVSKENLYGKGIEMALVEYAQRVAHQPPRARGITSQNRKNLAREAVGWMRVFGGSGRFTFPGISPQAI
jgi:hypothetical protein